MRVVVAPDSFGGTLPAHDAARAIADGWARARPQDEISRVPVADGGEGTLDVLASLGGDVHEIEVAGPHGKPVRARWLLRRGTAYIESAEACGLARMPESQRNPLRTTTYGVGQLLVAAHEAGAERVVVGLGGSATVDGGAGALTALGLRLLRENGHGLKVGGGELHHLRSIATGWLSNAWQDIAVECWADVRTPLLDAPRVFGPQKGAGPDDVELLRRGLERLADVVERDLDVARDLRAAEFTGAAGGLGYGLAAGVGASLVDGAAAVADLIGLGAAIEQADLVITGEGALDATSLDGKVVGHVVRAARAAGTRVAAVVGVLRGTTDLEIEQASPEGPGPDPAGDVADAAQRLAARLG